MEMKMTGMKTFLYIVIPLMIILAVLSLIVFFFQNGDREEAAPSLGTGTTLYKSDDGGLTWKLLDKFAGGEITTLDFDSSDSDVLLVGTKTHGVWRGSTDGGEWRQYPGGVGEGARIFDLIEPIIEEKFVSLVLFTNRGRVVEFENGNRKELFFTPLERFAFLKGYRSADGFLRVIGSDGGFYESQNDGATWRSISRFGTGLLAMTFNPLDDSEIWVLDPRGNFYRSTNGGNTWTNLTNGLQEFQGTMEVGFIYFEPQSGFLYHGSKHGLLSSPDSGRIWSRVELIVAPESLPATSMAVDPDNPRKLYVAILSQIYISEDGGQTWKGIQVPGEGIISNMLINPRDTDEVFIGFRSN